MYKITVEKLKEKEDESKYDSYDTVYEQKLESIDVSKLAIFINNQEK